MTRPDRSTILDARALSRALQRMAVEVLELAHGTEHLVLIGIQRRGVELAARIAKLIEEDEGVVVDRGGRELPIQADIVGKALKTGPGERVDVLVEEVDGRDEVDVVRP